MKNVFFLLLFCFQVICSQAANISVSIANSTFGTISNILEVGDIITWTNTDGFTHTVSSVTVPSGAPTFNQTVTAGNTFQYTITTAGSYTYRCNIHTSMTGGFQVNATTTATVKPSLTLDALYPNPAVDNVHIESPKTITSVDVYAETGAFIKTVTFSSAKIDLPVGDLKKGIYLIRIVSEDGLVETRRIIKN